jgi:hypothetical protein
MKKLFVLSALFLFIALPVILSFPALADDSKPPRWEWACRTDGFYQMSVLPDGTFKPSTGNTFNKDSITIKLEEKPCGNESYAASISIPDDGPSGNITTLDTSWPNVCYETTEVHLSDITHDVLADFHTFWHDTRHFLSVEKADQDWRFVLSSTHLETDKECRESKIEMPGLAANCSPDATTWMLTGQCVLQNAP